MKSITLQYKENDSKGRPYIANILLRNQVYGVWMQCRDFKPILMPETAKFDHKRIRTPKRLLELLIDLRPDFADGWTMTEKSGWR
jgi:hypothetical protein